MAVALRFHTDVVDLGLNEIVTDATTVFVCSALPTTYAEASSTYKLGSASISFNAPAAASAADGRKIASNAITGGSITGSGTVSHFGVCDASRLLAAGAIDAAEAVTSGWAFSLGAMSLVLPFQTIAGGGGGAGRGLFAGGWNVVFPLVDTIEYITISTTGNATDFGNLSQPATGIAACASTTRAVFGGGYYAFAEEEYTSRSTIEYVTIASLGNVTYFGELTLTRYGFEGCGSATRGLFGGGMNNINVIDYVTIATIGNAIDFGDLVYARGEAGACSSPTRGVFGGGQGLVSGKTNIIEYVTIATTGNTTDFGDLASAKSAVGACSNSTRGLFAGGDAGSGYVTDIEYITIASTGNAIDFGDLTSGRILTIGSSNDTRAVFGGGDITTGPVATMDYVTIASTGNASNFGNLSAGREEIAGCSDAHGGLA